MPECNMCGKCCESFYLNSLIGQEDIIEKIFLFEALLFWKYVNKDLVDIVAERNRFKSEIDFNYPQTDMTVLKFMLVKKEKMGEYGCRFLVDNKCSIYPYRPEMCKDYGTKYPCSHEGCSMRNTDKSKRLEI
jgi:Fe-S-cluster containining protein